MAPIAFPQWTLGLVVCVLAAIYDFRWRKIPNALNGGAAALVLLFIGARTVLQPLPLVLTLGLALLGALVPLVLFPLFMLRALGAGDIKLLMVLGLLLGPGNSFRLVIITVLLGGVGALLVFAYHTGWQGIKNLFLLRGAGLRQEPALKIKFPYSGAIGLGYCWVVWRYLI